jgi:hypothetical protein
MHHMSGRVFAGTILLVPAVPAIGTVSSSTFVDRPEPGRQGESLAGEAVVLPIPYSRGERRRRR